MEIKVLNNEQINEEIGEEITSLIKKNPKAILGLATGSSPIGVYNYLIEAYQQKRISFKDITSFNLDEYEGLEEEHPQSYRYFMNNKLFNQIDIELKNTHIPSLKNTKDNIAVYDKEIQEYGGVDYQILGIGSDGHIAFNEPGTSFDSTTHIVKLKESTIKDNSRFFNSIDEVPISAITQGLRTIMGAKRIVLIATGANKAKAVKEMVEGEISTSCPASILRKHPNVTIYCDREASALLTTIKE